MMTGCAVVQRLLDADLEVAARAVAPARVVGLAPVVDGDVEGRVLEVGAFGLVTRSV
jgi:hypothetical protein